MIARLSRSPFTDLRRMGRDCRLDHFGLEDDIEAHTKLAERLLRAFVDQ
jgi:hypothetical protein